MILHTLTSDPSIGLQLGRRLAETARRRNRPSLLHAFWNRMFERHPVKFVRAEA